MYSSSVNELGLAMNFLLKFHFCLKETDGWISFSLVISIIIFIVIIIYKMVHAWRASMSYGCTREVGKAREKRSSGTRRSRVLL